MSFFDRNNTMQTRIYRLEGELLTLRAINSNLGKQALTYLNELRHVHRAITRRNAANRRIRARLELVTTAAIELRKAQRAYMADRGNDAFGNEVARRARELDAVLPPYTERDKQLAAIHGSPVVDAPYPDPVTPGMGVPIL